MSKNSQHSKKKLKTLRSVGLWPPSLRFRKWLFDWFSTTVFFSETLGRPQKCYSWIWHFLAFDDSWPSTKVGGLRRRRGKFCSRIIGPSLQHKWGKSLWKRKEAGEYRFLYYFSKVFSLFNKSRFDSTNWIKKKARGKIVSKEILLSDSPFLSFSSLGTTIFIWFSDIVRPCYSLLLRPRNSLFIYDSG